MQSCNQFTTSIYGNDAPVAKNLSLIFEEELSKDHDTILEVVRKKTQSLLGQNKMAMDYLSDIEVQLETWLACQEGSSGTFNVM